MTERDRDGGQPSVGNGDSAPGKETGDESGDSTCVGRTFVLDLGRHAVIQVEGAGRAIKRVGGIGPRGARTAIEAAMSLGARVTTASPEVPDASEARTE